MKTTLLLSIVVASASLWNVAELQAATERCDVLVYGGNAPGIVAGIQAARLGKRVIVVEPSKHLGGLTTGGLGATDTGRKQTVGGIAREFYEHVATHYAKSESWKYESAESPSAAGQEHTPDPIAQKNGRSTRWTFEPHVAMDIVRRMLADAKLTVRFKQRIASVKKNGARLAEVRMDDGRVYEAAMFIDASYEGDLMAAAGVDYTWGRESNSRYGEMFNGVRPYYPPVRQFYLPVDPYREIGKAESGLLPGISSAVLKPVGEADQSCQAYNFRLCLTQVAENKRPWTKPDGYEAADYELPARFIAARVAAKQKLEVLDFFGPVMMPNRKSDVNNSGPFSTDWIGGNHDYPNADYRRREEIVRAHERYTRGLFWFLSSDPRVPAEYREAVNSWGLTKDEFPETGGWSPQLYIREARRMVADYVMTDRHCRGLDKAPDGVSLASYIIDSHQCNRVLRDGRIENEGDIGRGPAGPWAVSYRSIVPKRGQCDNLLVPVCISATHAAYGSIRMEPVFMMIAQASATAAIMAMDGSLAVQEVSYADLRRRLESDGLVVEWNEPLKLKYDTIDPRSLPGIVVDDREALAIGAWWLGGPDGFIGEGYLQDRDRYKGDLQLVFRPKVPKAGRYTLNFYYSGGGNRASNVPLTVVANGRTIADITIDEKPRRDGKPLRVGRYDLPAGEILITLSNRGTDGIVTADAVQLVPLKD